MLREYLSCNHLLMQLALSKGVLAFSRLYHACASWSIITRRAVLWHDGALARLTLASDHGRIRRDDEGGHGFFRFLDLGR